MWFCQTRPGEVDLFLPTLDCGRNRIARWLTDTMSAQAGGLRGAETRRVASERISLVHRAPERGCQRGNLDRSPYAQEITPALTSLRKERLNMCRPMKQQ